MSSRTGKDGSAVAECVPEPEQAAKPAVALPELPGGTPSATGDMIWYDGTRLPIEGKGFYDTEHFYDRFSAKRLTWKGNGELFRLTQDSAGLCYRLTVDAKELRIRWVLRSDERAYVHIPATGASGVDLYKLTPDGWRYVKVGFPRARENEMTAAWTPGTPALVYLPLYNGVETFEIGVPPGGKLLAPPPRASGVVKPVVVYGASIEQGGCSSRPGMAWPAIMGRLADVPVINLGCSGEGNMEIELADALAELDTDCYIVNTPGNMKLPQIDERYERFLRRLNELRPNVPVLVQEVGDVYNRPEPDVLRSRCREIFAKMKAGEPARWKRWRYIAGTTLLGTDGEGTVDGTHLNDLGALRQGRVYADEVRRVLKLPRLRNVHRNP